ncbi:helix-turn-helix domain-containing protein [Agathobacter ruminis]|uniref:Transposase n=1 Tax=Agathobacter ruminis TaxID=1712665 RepID=A0A2G3E0S7_9FIRM|nr:helix-turn-helix domain-containing protein [Agathobacter ruminis]MDC7301388.1 helix-turn-helix domain-containing protein [Agathobacter ruminis]PHU36854.1 transposase [Agathobacter ruminis]
MRYSYEYKRKCVELFRQGIIPDVPEGISRDRFLKYLNKWMRLENANGPGALKHNNQHKIWEPDDKLVLVSKVIAGQSISSVAIDAGINEGMLYQWVRKYKIYGYNGLINQKKGRKPMNPKIKKVGTRKPPKPDESEYEELIRLRAENEYMKAEIEVIKKEIALREQKEAARLKAKKQRSSKNSEKMDSN